MENNELELKALYYKALDCYKKKDDESREEGYLFLQEAAAKGSADAMKLIGVLMMSGQYDPYPRKDMATAVTWYQQAAQAGDEEAMYWLSQCYELGMGVKASKREARKWRKQAIAHGFETDDDEPEETEAPAQNTVKPQAKPEAKQEAKPSAKQKEEVKPLEPLVESAVNVKDLLPGHRKAEQENAAKAQKQSVPLQAEEAVKMSRYRDVAMPAVLDLAADAQEADRRDDEDNHLFADSYQRSMLFKGAGVGLLISGIFMGLIYLLFRGVIDTQQSTALFVALLAIVVLGGTGLGAVAGIRRAASRSQREDQYRKTAFYQCYHADLDKMDEQQKWCYQIYRSMEKYYLPVSNRKVPDLTAVREYRGVMYPGWVFGAGRDDNRPEFVFLTDRAVYVVCTRHLSGKLTGAYRDLDWMMEDAQDRTGLVKVENLILKNELQTETVKQELQRVSKIPMDQLPFYNIVFLSEEADTSELRITGTGERTMLVQGPYDRLRIILGGKESTIHTHGIRLDAMIDAFGTLGAEWLHREIAANPRR